ncbi:hypothetical protein FQN57_002303 [Myotisia sp. PD_48]|nr:hypothetical protein FQN57_002303 [Myotisia sp. PD_48]
MNSRPVPRRAKPPVKDRDPLFPEGTDIRLVKAAVITEKCGSWVSKSVPEDTMSEMQGPPTRPGSSASKIPDGSTVERLRPDVAKPQPVPEPEGSPRPLMRRYSHEQGSEAMSATLNAPPTARSINSGLDRNRSLPEHYHDRAPRPGAPLGGRPPPGTEPQPDPPSNMGSMAASFFWRPRNREQLWEQEAHKWRTEALQQRQSIAELQEGSLFTKNENFELREKIKELNSVIRRMQERAFGGVGGGRWTAQPDQTIRDNLSLFQRQIRDWSKEYAIESILMMEQLKLTGDEKDDFLNALAGVMTLAENGSIPEYLYAGKMGKRLPAIILNALLARDIYTLIFDDPFYFLSQSDATPDHTTSVDSTPLVNETLNKIYEEIKDVNEREAHIWRSQLVRVYNPPNGIKLEDSEIAAKAKMKVRIQRCSEYFASIFHAGPAQHLFRHMSKDNEICRLKKLRDIYISAGHLATRLWTQRTFTTTQHLEDLRVDPFRNNSPTMEAHPSQGLEDDEDHTLDGAQIAVVVHPAVLAFGNDDCENFHQARVWAKAVVLLSPP